MELLNKRGDHRGTYESNQSHSYIRRLKNMKAHLRYEVSIEWLQQFPDIKKLSYLNHAITRKRDCDGFTTEIYMAYIEKFYAEVKFNLLYSRWLETRDKWIKPSLDHIVSKSGGGSLTSLDNLQFISWLENRAKVNIPPIEWEDIKLRIGDYL